MRLKFARTFHLLGKVKIFLKKVCVSFLNYPHLIIKIHYTFSILKHELVIELLFNHFRCRESNKF